MRKQCPNCQSFHTIKKGTRHTKQRFKCLDCGKWFSFSNSIPSNAKILLFDIETAQMEVKVWQLKQHGFIQHHRIVKDWFILCWSAKWLYSNETIGECVTPKEAKKRDDLRIMIPMWKLLDEADIVIGHNVKKFDVGKINARFSDHGFTNPPLPYQIIDTLLQSRGTFNYSSHKLDFITGFLKLPQKLKTEIELWDGCEAGKKEYLDRMFEYCNNDVVINEEVYLLERSWMKNHPNLPLYGDLNEERCSYCNSTNLQKIKGKYYVTPMNKYPLYRCECGAVSRGRKSVITPQQKSNLVRSIAR